MKVRRAIGLGICYAVFFVAVLMLSIKPWFDVSVNLTKSLPGTVYLVKKGGAFNKGDKVAFLWMGGATYPKGSVFIKIVSGMPGDVVRVSNNKFWVNETYIGEAKSHSKAGVPLSRAKAGVIDDGSYFVSTPSKDSLDSRYALTGNIRAQQIIGRAYEVF